MEGIRSVSEKLSRLLVTLRTVTGGLRLRFFSCGSFFAGFEANCIGCLACRNACPTGAISVQDRPLAGLRTIKIDLRCCTGCSCCIAACPLDPPAISRCRYPEDSSSASEFMLFSCSVCGAPMFTDRMLGHIRERAGAAAVYSSPDLFLPSSGLALGSPAAYRKLGSYSPGEYCRPMCPDCRREASNAEG